MHHKVRKKGNLEYRTTEYDNGDSKTFIVLTECPACGEEFPENGGCTIRSHISSHSPEDFGLPP